jgi:hypothetical protein
MGRADRVEEREIAAVPVRSSPGVEWRVFTCRLAHQILRKIEVRSRRHQLKFEKSEIPNIPLPLVAPETVIERLSRSAIGKPASIGVERIVASMAESTVSWPIAIVPVSKLPNVKSNVNGSA